MDKMTAGLPPEPGRTADRVVHVKGAAAHGYLEVTHDISGWCRAEVFAAVGRRTPVLCRFSTAGGEPGLADTVRDVRGFAVRHRAAGGVWDLVGHDTPVFFISDPSMFPSFIHTQRRDPVTLEKDLDSFWDFITLRPETMHQVSLLFSDRGLPDGYRHMHGYGSHAFKLVNAAGQHVWAKFHYKTEQGVRTLSTERAAELAAAEPNYFVRDLEEALAAGQPPSWTLCVQLMTPAQAARCLFDPFDLTRVWPHGQYPLQPVGRLVLERVASETDVRHVAFSPANMPDGIEPSPDPMLQARLFSYSDTQQHRLGPNYSRPAESGAARADGAAEPSAPEPDGGGDWKTVDSSGRDPDWAAATDDAAEDFSQVRAFWERVLDDDGRWRLADNMAAYARDTQVFIQVRIVKNWSMVCEDFGQRVLTSLLKHNTPAKADELRRALDASAEDVAA